MVRSHSTLSFSRNVILSHLILQVAEREYQRGLAFKAVAEMAMAEDNSDIFERSVAQASAAFDRSGVLFKAASTLMDLNF